MQYITLLWCLKRSMFVTYCTIVLGIPRTLLHILYATWNFMHYQHLIDPVYQQSCHLHNTGCLFLYQVFRLRRMWLTVYFLLVNTHM